MKLKLLLTLLVLSVISLTACTATPAFENIDWVLESYGEKGNLQPAIEGSEPTAKFDSAEGQVAGSAGCNRYFAGYEVDNTKLSISQPGSTMMYCEGKMDQEQEFLKILQAAGSYQVKDGKLQITSGNKILIFKQK